VRQRVEQSRYKVCEAIASQVGSKLGPPADARTTTTAIARQVDGNRTFPESANLSPKDNSKATSDSSFIEVAKANKQHDLYQTADRFPV
jgi:hypothetical protein